ncbi:MAG: hypothetical protein MJ077_08085 [Oscillospiraceae bacterium]|nr:hypothetical protein [Oscillospiraceae bacterium]
MGSLPFPLLKKYVKTFISLWKNGEQSVIIDSAFLTGQVFSQKSTALPVSSVPAEQTADAAAFLI